MCPHRQHRRLECRRAATRAGWQQWSIDLSAYAGGNVEISIAYATDWATQGIGVFVDDITLPDGTSTSFETGLDGWTIAGPPEGSAPNVNNFTRTDASGFPVGNAISTPHSLLLGFGLEGISTRPNATRSWPGRSTTCWSRTTR